MWTLVGNFGTTFFLSHESNSTWTLSEILDSKPEHFITILLRFRSQAKSSSCLILKYSQLQVSLAFHKDLLHKLSDEIKGCPSNDEEK